MNTLISILPWVIGSVGIGLGIGFYLGLSRSSDRDKARSDTERESTVRVLMELLGATEQLTNDVNNRNVEIKEVGQDLIELDVDGELQVIQNRLMTQVSRVLESNMRLEDDLTVTRFQVEQQAELIDEARHEARTDALSGVGNRKALDERVKGFLAGSRRDGQTFALLLADVDHFKWVNDTHGHPAGDALVAHIGEFLKKCVRGNDFVARFGGDEFALLLYDVNDEMALHAAKRLYENVCQHTFDLGRGAEQVAVTFSIGVVSSWKEATSEELLKRADDALYLAKETGRNKACCYWNGEVMNVSQAMSQLEASRKEEQDDEQKEEQVDEQKDAAAAESDQNAAPSASVAPAPVATDKDASAQFSVPQDKV